MFSCIPKTPARLLVGLMFGAFTLTSAGGAVAQNVLHVYGPGGPAPAMKEAAAAFEKKGGVSVEVTAGPHWSGACWSPPSSNAITCSLTTPACTESCGARA